MSTFTRVMESNIQELRIRKLGVPCVWLMAFERCAFRDTRAIVRSLLRF
jgi:hypothetical protein